MANLDSASPTGGLTVAAPLREFIEGRVLPGLGISPESFWAGMAEILKQFTGENRDLLQERDRMEKAIDRWCEEKGEDVVDPAAQIAFLTELGYLVEEPGEFAIDPPNVDAEVASIAGPQLVVPASNARFLLNAANARWGSLYDALYGTDALPGKAQPGGYDAERGAQVTARAKAFLDEAAPLLEGHHVDGRTYKVVDGALEPALADPSCFAGYRGDPAAPSAILLKHNGLHIELVIDPTSPVGKDDPAGVADVLMEAAITTIVDLEDSVAAVDAADKAEAYANWLGLMRGDLEASFEKGGKTMTRVLAPDRDYIAPSGEAFSLPGRSLLFVRNVGLLMTTPAVLLPDGSEAPEGIVDTIVTTAIAMHDLKGLGPLHNSTMGSVYIVKPKQHGPAEADFTNRLCLAVEDMLGLAPNTIKIGLMDEERRTSANLAACIHALRHRIMFINTGFLDRTGDEMHTSTRAGPMLRKGDIKTAGWLTAYEDRNVLIGLACGFAGHAQIGKGMWAMPDRMADMIEQKVGHPMSGASTAWVPSPTAATLHAMHYHQVEVAKRQAARADEAVPGLDKLLVPPLALGKNWSEEEIRAEIDNNVQGILGYVVRWIDQGVGCSKVPDINDIGLMEDRATLRISSQHLANWLLHGVCTAEQVDEALVRMAAKVDAQNADDPLYRKLEPGTVAFDTARALIFEGLDQPSGYTEPLLHANRAKAKALT